MKKKIIIVSILIILVIILLLIPRDVYKKIFKKDNGNVPDVKEELVYQTMYVKNSDEMLVGIKVGVKSIEEDSISQKWDLLTSSVATLPTGYSSPIAKSTTLYSHETSNGVLTLNVSNDFLESEGRKAIECIAWNYCNDEVSEVVVKIDDQVVNEINNYYFAKITKSIGVNFTFETNYLFESDYVTVVYHENDIVTPVTFFFDSTKNKMDYTIQKMVKLNDTMTDLVNAKAYSYEIKNNQMVVNFDYGNKLSDDLIATITDTIKLNYNVDSFTINGVESVLLQETFSSIKHQ